MTLIMEGAFSAKTLWNQGPVGSQVNMPAYMSGDMNEDGLRDIPELDY